MPTPREKDETEKDFISRCMSETKGEYPDTAQRYAVCKSYADKSSEKMKKQDLFVLVPKKSENRGKYLARCSAHPQIKGQFSPLKERLAYCLTSFNEYYKYWTKIEAFAEVPSDTALGDCIAKEKAKGFDYKESYAHCASKVVVQPGPVVLSEDNLLIEPVLGEECPPETQDIELNLANRQKCIDEANYGPLNPNEPNEEYWRKKADQFQGDIKEAKKALCGNCVFFIQTKSMLDCIAEGIGGDDAWDSIDAGDLGYCEAYDFKCAASRTCDAWVVGGPITEDEYADLEDACWEGYEPIGLKEKDGRMVPNCVPVEQAKELFLKEETSFNDYPESAKNNACKAIKWKEEHGDEVKGMTQVGWIRANQLCKKEKISKETIGRMSGFQRHRKNAVVAPEFKSTPWKDSGYVAWLGWGGESGVSWAENKLKQLEK